MGGRSRQSRHLLAHSLRARCRISQIRRLSFLVHVTSRSGRPQVARSTAGRSSAGGGGELLQKSGAGNLLRTRDERAAGVQVSRRWPVSPPAAARAKRRRRQRLPRRGPRASPRFSRDLAQVMARECGAASSLIKTRVATVSI